MWCFLESVRQQTNRSQEDVMMRSPQGISPNGSGTSSARPVTSSCAVKMLSLLLAVLMLCTTTTFITARVVHRQAKLIAGDFVLPITSGSHVIKGGAVLGDHPRPTATRDATVAHSHLDPHRRLPAAEGPRVAARAVPHQQARRTLATDRSQARYGHGRQDREDAVGEQVVTIAR
jgi:hypothetical protein